ncbi:MAG: HEAT repeat domain-containing protein [Bacteroidales bacterium]|nr:HEAT repeat domain-containing protein [Bacteroidales bacterium]
MSSIRHITSGIGCTLIGLTIGCGSKTEPPTSSPSPPPSMYTPPTQPKSGLTALIRKLKSTSSTSRSDAADELAREASSDPKVIPALIEALADLGNRGLGQVFPQEVNSTREAVVLALLQAGPAGELAFDQQALPRLIAGLQDRNPAVRQHTAVALGRAGVRAQAALEPLWALATDDSTPVRGAAYSAILKIHPTSTLPAVKLLTHTNPTVRAHAAEMLSRLEPFPTEAIPLLTQALSDEDSAVRCAAAQALIPFGSQATAAVPALVAALQKTQLADLQKPDPIELAPTRALAAIGEAAVAPTTKLLTDMAPLNRYQAAYVLGEIGPAARSAVPALEKLLNDPAPEVILEAARAIAVIQGSTEKVTALMKFALGHAEAPTRLYALQTTLRMGTVGRELASLALPLLSDMAPEVRRAAVTYVGTLDAKTAQPAMGSLAKQLVQDSEESVRKEIAEVLGELGSTAAPAASALGQVAAQDPAPPVRTAALQALTALGPAGKDGLNGIITLANNAAGDADTRAQAVAVLPILGPKSEPALQAVLSASQDKSAIVREAAALAVAGFTPPSAAAIARLGTMVQKDSSFANRAAALRALAQLGPTAAAAKPAVEAAITEKSNNLRLWAKVALARIDGQPASALAVVRAGLASRLPGERQAAAEALPLLGEPSVDDVKRVAAMLEEQQPFLRLIAARVLAQCGTAARPVARTLAGVLKRDDDGEVRTAAARALGTAGDVSTEVIAALKEAEKTDPTSARAARASLRQLGQRKS